MLLCFSRAQIFVNANFRERYREFYGPRCNSSASANEGELAPVQAAVPLPLHGREGLTRSRTASKLTSSIETGVPTAWPHHGVTPGRVRDFFSNLEFDRQAPDSRRFRPHPASFPFSRQGGAGAFGSGPVDERINYDAKFMRWNLPLRLSRDLGKIGGRVHRAAQFV